MVYYIVNYFPTCLLQSKEQHEASDREMDKETGEKSKDPTCFFPKLYVIVNNFDFKSVS